jgi:Derlin-2/3
MRTFDFCAGVFSGKNQAKQLPPSAPKHQRTDFLFMLMLGAAFLSSVPALLGLPLMFTTAPLITMVIYVWSRNYPERPVSLYGLVTIQAFYLPFAFLAITVIMGGSPLMDLFGIAAGHLWYFFTDLYPRSSGRCVVFVFGGGAG